MLIHVDEKNAGILAGLVSLGVLKLNDIPNDMFLATINQAAISPCHFRPFIASQPVDVVREKTQSLLATLLLNKRNVSKSSAHYLAFIEKYSTDTCLKQEVRVFVSNNIVRFSKQVSYQWNTDFKNAFGDVIEKNICSMFTELKDKPKRFIDVLVSFYGLQPIWGGTLSKNDCGKVPSNIKDLINKKKLVEYLAKNPPDGNVYSKQTIFFNSVQVLYPTEASTAQVLSI